MTEELKARIAELEQKLCDSLDAERASYIGIAELERQQAALAEALGKTASHIEAMMAHIEHKPQRFKEHCWSQAVAARAALAAVKPAGQEGGEQPDADRSFAPEYEVWQDDIMVASASGHRPDAIREILHYAAQYQQDGPVQIFEVRRQLCSAEELVFAQNGLTEAKKADVMINGLTEAETTASASVAGLMGGE